MEARRPQSLPPSFDNQGNWYMSTMKIIALYFHHSITKKCYIQIHQWTLAPSIGSSVPSSQHPVCPQDPSSINLCIPRIMAPSILSVLGTQSSIKLYGPRTTAPSDSFPFQFCLPFSKLGKEVFRLDNLVSS